MFNFLKYRYFCAIFSAALFISFLGLFFYKRSVYGQAFSYSVDFTGGTQILLKFQQPITDEKLRTILEKNGWEKPSMRNFSSTEILTRIKEYTSNTEVLEKKIQQVLQKALPDNKVNILSIESVSGVIGSTLRWSSLFSLLLSLLLMLAYIWLRFWSFSYGVGAVVALFHDAIAILFIFLLLDKEISINVIGAILVTLGYSINDTIVIFSKIRHNIKTMSSVSIYDIVNISISQTLRRTILTSAATLLVVLSLFIIGGETLRDFSLALLVGVVFGTYSSIYIASPVMLSLYKKAK